MTFKIFFFICVSILFTSNLFAGDNSPIAGAQISVSEDFLKQFSAVQTSKKVDIEDGKPVYVTSTTTITPKLEPSDNLAHLSFNVNVKGVGTTTHDQKVGPLKRRSVSVGITSNLNANYYQDVFLDEGGLRAGEVTEVDTNLSSKVNSTNDFRFPRLNVKVNQIAKQKANQRLQEKDQYVRNKNDREIKEGVTNGMDQTALAIQEVWTSATSIIPESLSSKYKFQLTSQPGRDGRIQMQVSEKTPSSTLSAPPTLDFEKQAATKTFIHESLPTGAINTALKGKELNLGELQAYLCGAKIAPLLDFCEKGIDEKTKNYAILFDEEEPVKFTFKDGKVGVHLNCVFRVMKEDKTKVANKDELLKSPSDSRTVFYDSVPYSIDFSYDFSEGKTGKLTGPVIQDKPVAQVADSARSSSDGRQHGGSGGGATSEKDLRAVTNQFFGNTIKKEIAKNFSAALKSKIDLEPISLPMKVKIDENGKTTFGEVGSLIPLEVKVENGWVSMASAYCSENFSPLGANFSQAEGGALKIDSLASNGPAVLQGLQPGDQISSYGEVGQPLHAIVDDGSIFKEYLKKLSKKPKLKDRVVEISVKDAQGKSFRRKVSLCPFGFDHRSNLPNLK